MQNALLVIVVALVIVGGGYLLLMNTGDTNDGMVAETEPAMDETMPETEPMNEPMDAAAEAEPEPAGPTIVETAVAADDFTTLVTAVEAAELVETLSGEGPYTVFAPTDAAFAALPDGTVDTLLQPDSQSDLTNILTYHVVPGEVMASDLSDGMTATTVNGETITFTIDADGGVMVNDANVVSADIEASNGVIHVIDSVLIPSAE